MAMPLGSALFVIAAQLIMESHNRQTVFIVLALAMVFLQAIPSMLVLCRRPEDLGLVPDGGTAVKAEAALTLRTPVKEEFSLNLSELLRNRSLCLLILGRIAALTVGAGIV